MKSFFSTGSIIAILLLAIFLVSEAQQCSSSGKIIGTSGKCNQEHGAECCKDGESYLTYTCSPPVSGNTQAKLHLNSFEAGGDGGYQSKCDSQYHDDNTLVVALSTGWYDNNSRCLKNITINGNGMSVDAMVVDECDSTKGCDAEHDYQPPCPNNIVDASKAVWEALGVSEVERDEIGITWSDA